MTYIRTNVTITIDVYVHDIFYKTIRVGYEALHFQLTMAVLHAEVERQLPELQGQRFRVFYSAPRWIKEQAEKF